MIISQTSLSYAFDEDVQSLQEAEPGVFGGLDEAVIIGYVCEEFEPIPEGSVRQASVFCRKGQNSPEELAGGMQLEI